MKIDTDNMTQAEIVQAIEQLVSKCESTDLMPVLNAVCARAKESQANMCIVVAGPQPDNLTDATTIGMVAAFKNPAEAMNMGASLLGLASDQLGVLMAHAGMACGLPPYLFLPHVQCAALRARSIRVGQEQQQQQRPPSDGTDIPA